MFFKAATDKVSGGKHKVNWKIVSPRTNLGELGVLDLEKFAIALCLRWSWLEWKHPNRSWVGLNYPCDVSDMELFYGAVKITTGDGHKAKLWLRS